jgi:hypothetical protein
MTHIYIVTDSFRDGQSYKCGIHTGTRAKLKSRYKTSMPSVTIKHLWETPHAAAIETALKAHYAGAREPHENGTLSEWYKVSLDELTGFITKHLAPPPEVKVPEPEPAGIRYVALQEIQQWHCDSVFQYPAYQRPVDDERAAEIRKYIIEKHSTPAFAFGPIVINRSGARLRVIDGQHRLHALFKLGPAAIPASLTAMRFPFDVRASLTQADERELFKAINSSVPCPRLLLMDEEKASMYGALRAYLVDTFPDYGSASPRCIPPRFNIDVIMNTLAAADIVKELWDGDQINTPQDLINGVESVNTALGARFGAPDAAAARDVFARYQTGVRRKIALEKFVDLVAKTRARARDGRPICWLGLMPPDRWMAFVCNLGIFH